MSLSIVLPAYQEAENIPIIIPKIHSILSSLKIEYEILIIDTIEPMDNTPNLASEYSFTYCPRLFGNNYGDAIRTGINKAKYDYIVVMDCDGSHDADVISTFWHLRDKADLVIGSRYVKGGKTDNPFILIFLSWVVNVIFKIVLGLKVNDISNSFRMYKAKDIKQLELECNNFDIVEEILIKIIMKNPSIKIYETPITFNKRSNGISKRNLLKFIVSYISTLCRLYYFKNQGNSK